MFFADISVYASDKRLQMPQMLVEINSTKGKSKEWAVAIRDRLLSQYSFRPPLFFLLVLLDATYFWDASSELAIEPIYQFETKELLKKYAEQFERFPRLSNESFALLVIAWLDDLVTGRYKLEPMSSSLSKLEASGLLAAIADGVVKVGERV
jgi:hypothetical protein